MGPNHTVFRDALAAATPLVVIELHPDIRGEFGYSEDNRQFVRNDLTDGPCRIIDERFGHADGSLGDVGLVTTTVGGHPIETPGWWDGGEKVTFSATGGPGTAASSATVTAPSRTAHLTSSKDDLGTLAAADLVITWTPTDLGDVVVELGNGRPWMVCSADGSDGRIVIPATALAAVQALQPTGGKLDVYLGEAGPTQTGSVSFAVVNPLYEAPYLHAR